MNKFLRNIFVFISVAYVFYVTNTFVQIVIPPNSAWIALFVLLACLAIYPMTLLKDIPFLSGCLYVLFLILWPLLFHNTSGFGYGSGDIDTGFIEAAFLLPSLAISSILFKKNDQSAIRIISMAAVISMATSFLFVLPFVIGDNSIARMVTAKEFYMGDHIIPGFWNYQMLHAFVLLLPVMWAYAYSVPRKKKIIYIFLVLAIIVLSIQVSIMTVIVNLLIGLVALVNLHIIRARYTIFFLVAELIVLSVLIFYTPEILDKMIIYYEETDMVEKLEDVQSVLLGRGDNNETISSRSQYHEDAINAFLDNPFIGSCYEGGGHSTILNRLGAMGFIGAFPFLFMLFAQFFRWGKRMSKRMLGYYMIAIVEILVLMMVKSVFGCEGWLMSFVFIPVMLYNLDLRNQNPRPNEN